MGRRSRRVRWRRRDDSWGHQAEREGGREDDRGGCWETWMGVCSPMTLASRGKRIEENESNCHVPTGQNQLINHTERISESLPFSVSAD